MLEDADDIRVRRVDILTVGEECPLLHSTVVFRQVDFVNSNLDHLIYVVGQVRQEHGRLVKILDDGHRWLVDLHGSVNLVIAGLGVLPLLLPLLLGGSLGLLLVCSRGLVDSFRLGHSFFAALAILGKATVVELVFPVNYGLLLGLGFARFAFGLFICRLRLLRFTIIAGAAPLAILRPTFLRFGLIHFL